MPEQQIEKLIREVLSEEAQANALTFVACLKEHEMLFERGGGYWEDKFYWMIRYKGEYVCFILLNSSDNKDESAGWTIWSDDSGSGGLADFPLDEHMNEIIWKNVDVCGHCGGCKNIGGRRRTILGRDFDNVCITALKFVNPDAVAVECAKKVAEIRKDEILRNM